MPRARNVGSSPALEMPYRIRTLTRSYVQAPGILPLKATRGRAAPSAETREELGDGRRRVRGLDAGRQHVAGFADPGDRDAGITVELRRERPELGFESRKRGSVVRRAKAVGEAEQDFVRRETKAFESRLLFEEAGAVQRATKRVRETLGGRRSFALSRVEQTEAPFAVSAK